MNDQKLDTPSAWAFALGDPGRGRPGLKERLAEIAPGGDVFDPDRLFAMAESVRSDPELLDAIEDLSPIPVEALDDPESLYALEEYEQWEAVVAHPEPLVVAEYELAEERVDGLIAEPMSVQVAKVETDPGYRLWAVAKALLRRSSELRFSNPSVCLERVLVAEALAFALGSEFDLALYGREWIEDLRCETSAAVGNALRVCARFSEAELAFDRAEQAFRRSEQRAERRGDLLLRRASLRIDQGRELEAEALLEGAVRSYESAGCEEGVLFGLMNLGRALASGERWEQAVGYYARALDLSLSTDGVWTEAIVANLSNCYVESGHASEARELLSWLAVPKEALPRARYDWTLSRLAALEGRLLEALERSEALRLRFEELNMLYDAAVVVLDSASIYSRLGEEDRVLELTTEAGGLLALSQAPPQAMEQIAMLRKAAQARNLGMATIQAAIRQLQRLPIRR